jgi:hypothetical protein
MSGAWCRSHARASCADVRAAPAASFPKLAAGAHLAVGRFTCRVARASVSCVVTATGKAMRLT